MVPADAVAGPEPGHRAPGVGREPQEHPGRLRARQRGGHRELDPGVSAGVVEHLLDHGHPLAAHTHRGQDRVGPVRTRGPFGHSRQRLVAGGRVPVVPARPEPWLQMAEQRLLELLPPGARLPPAPVGPGPFQPGREPFHGVVERPAKRRLTDHVAAVARHAAVHVGPARDDRERPPVLQDRDPVPFLEPQRFQRAGLQRRPAARVLGAGGGHQRRAPGVQPGLVGGLRSGPVVGDPGGRYRGGVVVQIGGRGQAVVFDGHLPASVGAETLEQRDRRPRLPRPGGFWLRCAHDRKCTDSAAPHKPFASKGSRSRVIRALSWCGSGKKPFLCPNGA